MSWAAAASDGGRAAFAASRALLSRQSLPSAVSFSYWHLSSSGSKRAGIAEESQLVPAPAAAIPSAEGGLSVQLVRDFIHNSLYHPTDGYFSKQTSTGAAVVGRLAAPLDFRGMAGQTEYLLAVKQQYQKLQASWLTPVEIFQPHYGRAFASCILQRWRRLAPQRPQGQPLPLHIYELGGGTGTLARNILDWLREEHPDAYQATQYRCIEISPVLAALQRQHVAVDGGHAGRFAVRRHDAADAAAWAAADAAEAAAGASSTAPSSSAGPSLPSSSSSSSGGAGGGGGGGPANGGSSGGDACCFIVMTEVLDNLPHDRVCCSPGSSEWQQTMVVRLVSSDGSLTERRQQHQTSGGPSYSEVLQPASDPLILRCLAALEATSGSSGGASSQQASGLALAAARLWQRLLGAASGDVRWLPTGCLQLLDTLMQVRPSHTLLAADFTDLPEVSVAGAGAPLVATTVGGATIDHGSYLVPPGSADIFFPTDFTFLCELYRQACAAAAVQVKPNQSQAVDRPPAKAAHAAAASAGSAVERAAPAADHDLEAEAAADSTEHLSTADFMRRYCPNPAAATTRSGYNPLLEDFTNTAVFIGQSATNCDAG